MKMTNYIDEEDETLGIVYSHTFSYAHPVLIHIYKSGHNKQENKI